MKLRRLITSLMVAVALCLAASSAHALVVGFDFANPVADVPVSPFVLCDASGEDRCGETMTFTKSGLSVTASALDFKSPIDKRYVIEDLEPDKGGLGVVDGFKQGSVTGNDNVSDGDILIMTFSQPVLLLSVDFTDDHGPLTFDDFLFSTDGVSYASRQLAGTVAFGTSGTTFYFKHAGQDRDDFYIAGMSVDPGPPVPEPASVALLGAGLLGLAGRARRRARR